MVPPRPKRPVGVILSAIALGLFSAFLLLSSLVSFVGLLTGQTRAAMATSSPASPAGLLTGTILVMALFYLGVAAWSVATLVGLIRMRSWARVSAMVIAGCIALFSLLGALGMLAAQSLLNSGQVPVPPNIDPAVFHRMFAFAGLVCLVVAILGIVALVYFARRRTRNAFAPSSSPAQFPLQPPPYGSYPPPNTYPGASAGPYPPAPAWRASPPPQAPDPLTDFTVARPLVPPAPVSPAPVPPNDVPPNAVLSADPATAPPAPYWPQPMQPWPVAAPAPSAVPSGRPALVTVLAIFALISAFFSLFGVISPLPTFLFGFVVSGWPVHLYSLVWSAAMAIAGLGMLRLQRPAWVLSFVLLGISSLHFLVMLFPASRARFGAYMAAVQQRSTFGVAPPALPPSVLTMTIAIGMFFSFAVIVTIAILLWRARWAFAPAAPPAATDEPTVE